VKQISAEFATMPECSAALQTLCSHGVSLDDICVELRHGDSREQFAEEHGSRQVAGAFMGAITGGIIGALYGPTALRLLVAAVFWKHHVFGLRTGWLRNVESVMGGFIGWGLGGIVGGLIPRESAHINRPRVEEGGVLLTVATLAVDDRQVEQLLRQDGGIISPVHIAGYGQHEVTLNVRRISA